MVEILHRRHHRIRSKQCCISLPVPISHYIFTNTGTIAVSSFLWTSGEDCIVRHPQTSALSFCQISSEGFHRWAKLVLVVKKWQPKKLVLVQFIIHPWCILNQLLLFLNLQTAARQGLVLPWNQLSSPTEVFWLPKWNELVFEKGDSEIALETNVSRGLFGN